MPKKQTKRAIELRRKQELLDDALPKRTQANYYSRYLTAYASGAERLDGNEVNAEHLAQILTYTYAPAYRGNMHTLLNSDRIEEYREELTRLHERFGIQEGAADLYGPLGIALLDCLRAAEQYGAVTVALAIDPELDGAAKLRERLAREELERRASKPATKKQVVFFRCPKCQGERPASEAQPDESVTWSSKKTPAAKPAKPVAVPSRQAAAKRPASKKGKR